MITEDKVTELFCMADDFCKFFDAMMKKYTLKSDNKRAYHRDSTMSKSEIMLIMIMFHDSGYRCLKHFYVEKVCKHLRHLFPKVVSCNRFVELEKQVAVPLALFNVSSTKTCRDAFLRLGKQDCRIKSPVAKTWQLAETQECVSTVRQ